MVAANDLTCEEASLDTFKNNGRVVVLLRTFSGLIYPYTDKQGVNYLFI
jgi:hypothetical protein